MNALLAPSASNIHQNKAKEHQKEKVSTLRKQGNNTD